VLSGWIGLDLAPRASFTIRLMRDLVPSGRFAQLARLSRKALRLYAELGLLRPVHVNAQTGYRYYSLSQLEDASRIAHLRELGMPLEAIREAVRVWNLPDLKRHLELHRERLQTQAAQVQSALEALETLLQTLPQEYQVCTKSVQPQPYLGLRGWCHPDQVCHFIVSAQRRLYGFLRQDVIQPAGPCLARYHEEEDEAWDVEVCVPITEKPMGDVPSGMIVGELPAGCAAFTVHEGDCGGIHGMQGAYAAVWRWIREHGHETLGGPFEVYLFDESNTDRVEDYRTEVAWVIRKA
jgi:DNA-binding transcriptional MerR regulator/predicted transcriptional regulator YdeE